MKHVQKIMILGLMVVSHINAFAESDFAWPINFIEQAADCTKLTKCHECAISNCHWDAVPTASNKAAGTCSTGLYSNGKKDGMQIGKFFENAAKCEDTLNVCDF